MVLIAGPQDVRGIFQSQSAQTDALLPAAIAHWFAQRGWVPRDTQVAMLRQARDRRSTLLIAPTGAGKTLAGFLPSIAALVNTPKRAKSATLHTIYISPLKALAEDVARNLIAPIKEMELAIRVETRTGDTPTAQRARQWSSPPSILMTTPEQLALMLSHPHCERLFSSVDTVVLDELHALAPSKRGDLLALNLAHLRVLAPQHIRLGLSATVAEPSQLRAYLAHQSDPEAHILLADYVAADGGALPSISILDQTERALPWGGHSARYAMPEIYRAIEQHRSVIVFVNTRMQAELVFQELWRINEAGLPIALHHGSLDKAQRQKVEAALAAGQIRAVVATSTLDLGLDWGDVDLVINVGAPKGASRLLQRIGRANHRLDEASQALLVPANRFEVLECQAAIMAARASEQDAVIGRSGAIDVLAQHILGLACGSSITPASAFQQVRSALPYAQLSRERFDRIIDFVSTGGYALRAYDRFAKLRMTEDGSLCLSHPRFAKQFRLNAGTIVEAPMIKVRLVRQHRKGTSGAQRAFSGGRILGEVEEYFIDQLTPGMTFVFAGEVVRFEGLRETEAFVSRATDKDPMIPSYGGGRFPLSTHLAQRVREMLADPSCWSGFSEPVVEWLLLQEAQSLLPGRRDVLVETFPRNGRHYLVAYPFEGRLAHQTLGILVTRRLERAGLRPLGFVANDYGLAVWGLRSLSDAIMQGTVCLDALFDQDILGDDLEAWLAESHLLKRTFRDVAIISGLIERRHPGRAKTGRQMTVSSDLIYDVLMKHDPRHILLEAAWEDASRGLLDLARLGNFLARIKGHIRHQPLNRVSPLAVPILLEIGKEPVARSAQEDLLRDAAAALIAEVSNGDATLFLPPHKAQAG